jgi:hypothetical protein
LSFGQINQNKTLIDIGQRLENAIAAFDIEKISKCIQEFEQFYDTKFLKADNLS